MASENDLRSVSLSARVMEYNRLTAHGFLGTAEFDLSSLVSAPVGLISRQVVSAMLNDKKGVWNGGTIELSLDLYHLEGDSDCDEDGDGQDDDAATHLPQVQGGATASAVPATNPEYINNKVDHHFRVSHSKGLVGDSWFACLSRYVRIPSYTTVTVKEGSKSRVEKKTLVPAQDALDLVVLEKTGSGGEVLKGAENMYSVRITYAEHNVKRLRPGSSILSILV